jgi:hypothetical protein
MLKRMSIVLVALFAPSLALAAQDAEKCRLGRYGSIDILGFPETVVIPAYLDSDSRFLGVNTGSLGSVISDYAADELKINTLRSDTTISIDDKRVRLLAITKDFRLGEAKIGKWTFMVRRTEKRDTSQLPVVGYVGNDFLRNFGVEFDFANKKLNLYSKAHCPGQVVYWSDTSGVLPFEEGKVNDLVVVVELDGKKIEATLNTGSETSSMRLDAATKLFGLTSDSPGIDPIPGGPTIDYRYRFKSLVAADVKISNPEIVLYTTVGKQCGRFLVNKRDGIAGNSETSDCYSGPPLRLGMNFLSRLRFFVSYREKMIYLTPVEATR